MSIIFESHWMLIIRDNCPETHQKSMILYKLYLKDSRLRYFVICYFINSLGHSVTRSVRRGISRSIRSSTVAKYTFAGKHIAA